MRHIIDKSQESTPDVEEIFYQLVRHDQPQEGTLRANSATTELNSATRSACGQRHPFIFSLDSSLYYLILISQPLTRLYTLKLIDSSNLKPTYGRVNSRDLRLRNGHATLSILASHLEHTSDQALASARSSLSSLRSGSKFTEAGVISCIELKPSARCLEHQ